MTIASRRFAVLDADGVEVRTVVLEIDAPVQRGDWEWFTAFRIMDESWGEPVRSCDIFGIDPLASLIDAVFIASVHVQGRRDQFRESGLRLTWMGAEDLGIPGMLAWRPPEA